MRSVTKQYVVWGFLAALLLAWTGTGTAEEGASEDKKILQAFHDGKAKLPEVEAYYTTLKTGQAPFAQAVLSLLRDKVKAAQSDLDDKLKDVAYTKKHAQENPKHFGTRNIQDVEQKAEWARKKLAPLQADLERLEKEDATPALPAGKTESAKDSPAEKKDE